MITQMFSRFLLLFAGNKKRRAAGRVQSKEEKHEGGLLKIQIDAKGVIQVKGSECRLCQSSRSVHIRNLKSPAFSSYSHVLHFLGVQ